MAENKKSGCLAALLGIWILSYDIIFTFLP
jgi:hypothetical protein